MLSKWITTTLDDKNYFDILGSGLVLFEGIKDYLSTSSVNGLRIEYVEQEISYRRRPSRANMQPIPNSVWFAKMKNTIKVLMADTYLSEQAVLSTGFCGIHSEQVSSSYLKQIILSKEFNDQKDQFAEGSTQEAVSTSKVKLIRLGFPQSQDEQTKIAEVLSTVDQGIEQTEALIAKQQRIKTGMMQDLLTRGIDEHGNLRSEQTHKFKDSPLGRIPVEWEVNEFGQTVASAVDGPFGSNLKSDHYVDEPGVRVIRLGNIGNGKFLDQDKAWISSDHGRFLSRHAVKPLDILIGSLGDERHPFGRACLYTDNIHEAVVKADVFRIRCKSDKFVHSFAVHLFNFPRWRQGLFGLAQGVTRDRVNLTNMMLLQLPIPPISEQKMIARIIESTDASLNELQRQLVKLRSLKTALMQDLLTGKKRVTALLNDMEIVT